MTTASIPGSATAPSLWMHSKRYDGFFFIGSGLLCLLFILPYLKYGSDSIWPIYNVYLILFGLPHNYLTWATIFPGDSKRSFRMEPIVTAGLACLALCALIPFTRGTDFGDWILSFIAYYSLWHAYRQHHGICKVYDAIQARRTGDATVFADRKLLNFGFGLSAFAVLVWAFTRPHVDYLLSPEDKHAFVHPTIPYFAFQAYAAVAGAALVLGLKKATWDRYRAGKFVPVPQVLLLLVALCTYVIPYLFVPLEALPIPVAIGTMFHNIQYFGFVWGFERDRSLEMRADGHALGIPQRLAIKGSWASYFGIALAYSLFVVAFYLAMPKYYGLAFIYFIGIAHYIIDGYVWRRDTNRSLGKVMDRWVSRATT